MRKLIASILFLAVLALSWAAQPAGAQVTLRSTTLSADIDDVQTEFNVASGTGITAGMIAFVNGEVMSVTAISGTKLTVRQRGQSPSVNWKHTSGDTIYVDLPEYFGREDKKGRCAVTDTLATPFINLGTGNLWVCSGGKWISSGSSIVSGTSLVLTGTGASALAVGRQGSTNPVLNVNANTASVVTGLNLVGAAAAGGMAVSVTSSGANEALTIDAKGTGAIDVGTTSTGAIGLKRATNITGATGITGAATVTSAGASALAVGTNGATNPAFVVDSSVGSMAAGLKVTGAVAAGTVATAVVSSGADANLTLNAKGTGTIGIGSVSTGAVTITPATTITGATTLSGAVTQKANVISGSGATVALTAAQSGSVVAMDRAAGIVFTLPAPAVGMYFDFLANVSVTSNNYKVITDAGTTFILGSLVNIDTDTSNAVAAWTGNGTTHVAITMNGTTTGGLLGTMFRLTCVSSTVWMVQGIDQGNGVVATPFATS